MRSQRKIAQIVHVPRPGLVRAGHGRGDRRSTSRGDGRVRRRQQGFGPRPAAALLLGHRRGADGRPRCSSRRSSRRASRSTPRCGRAGSCRTTSSAIRSASSRRSAPPARWGSARRSRSCASAGSRWRRRRRSGPARWRRSSASPTRWSRALCRKIANVWPANYNCPGQLVISGETDAVDEACSEAQREGARRAIRLTVSGAFHSPFVENAAVRLRPAIDKIDFKVPTAQFVSTVTAKLEDVRPLPLAARRAADGAGALHAGRARADRPRRDHLRRGRARQRAQRFTEAHRQLRADVPGQRPGFPRRRRHSTWLGAAGPAVADELELLLPRGEDGARHRRLARDRPRDQRLQLELHALRRLGRPLGQRCHSRPLPWPARCGGMGEADRRSRRDAVRGGPRRLSPDPETGRHRAAPARDGCGTASSPARRCRRRSLPNGKPPPASNFTRPSA